MEIFQNISTNPSYYKISECIKENVNECRKPVWQLVPYLCGQEPFCRNRTDQAVQKAKENVQNKYFAVGILEEMDDFLKVLEYGLPAYFEGSREILHSKIGKWLNLLNYLMFEKHEVKS